MSKIAERTIKRWAHQYIDALPETVRRHISMARHDLYYGPIPEGDRPDGDSYTYPGFLEAISKIREALDDVPSVLYVDTMCEDWTENYPFEPEEIDGELYEVDPSNWYQYDRADLIREVLGKELASYL